MRLARLDSVLHAPISTKEVDASGNQCQSAQMVLLYLTRLDSVLHAPISTNGSSLSVLSISGIVFLHGM